MKKLLIISIIAMITLTGCGPSKGDDLLGNKFNIKSFTKGGALNSDVYILIDKKSGVNYYYVVAGHGRSLCPIYDKEGKVVIDKVEQE